MERPRRAEYTPVDFQTFRENGSLDLTPKFQRRSVWRTPQRSYLIDSLLRGMPVPPLYLRETQSPEYDKIVRQVVDGQQRLRAVLDFLDDKYAITRSTPAEWAGHRFSELPGSHQSRIRNYHFSAEVFVGISDAEVLDIFARMNTYSVKLNKQELRNGKYFGFFKQSCYRLAHEHIEFWRRHKIFTEHAIARMSEVELVSELLILGLDGLQDKKGTIDDFYADYDEEFPEQSENEDQFRIVIDGIERALGDSLKDTEFRRGPMFYTLYGAVYHYLFQLPDDSIEPSKKHRRIGKDAAEALSDVILKLSNVIALGRDEEASVPKKYENFTLACLRQTDNIGPRRTRLRTLLKDWDELTS